MKRPLRNLLTLITAGLSLYSMGMAPFAAPIEDRQGVMTEPARSETKGASDVVLLGTTPLPQDVLNKLELLQIVMILAVVQTPKGWSIRGSCFHAGERNRAHPLSL